MSEAAKRRWFRFSLRGLLFAVALAALLLGLWTHKTNNVRKWNELLTALRDRKVLAAEEYTSSFDNWRSLCDVDGIEWLFFGKQPYQVIGLFDGTFTDDDVQQLRSLFPEAEIWRVSNVPRRSDGVHELLDKL